MRRDLPWRISFQGQEILPGHRPHLPDRMRHSPESVPESVLQGAQLTPLYSSPLKICGGSTCLSPSCLLPLSRMKLFNPCRWIEYGWVKLVDLTSGRGYVGDAVGKTSRLKYLEHSCLLSCNLGGNFVSYFLLYNLLVDFSTIVCYIEIRVRQCHMLCILWPSPLLVRIWQKRRRVMMLTYQLHHNLFIGLLPQAFPNTSDGHFHVFPFFFVYGIIF